MRDSRSTSRGCDLCRERKGRHLSAVTHRGAVGVGYQAIERTGQMSLRAYAAPERGTSLAPRMGMTTSDRTAYVRRCASVTVLSASLLFGGSVLPAEAQSSASGAASASSSTGLTLNLGRVNPALTSTERQARNPFRQPWSPVAASPRKPLRLMWAPVDTGPPRGRWPLRADPRRWPRLFANTTECTLSFDPVLRRHWWQ